MVAEVEVVGFGSTLSFGSTLEFWEYSGFWKSFEFCKYFEFRKTMWECGREEEMFLRRSYVYNDGILMSRTDIRYWCCEPKLRW